VSRGGSIWPVLVALFVLVGAFLGALGGSHADVKALELVRATPRATLAAPPSGPAIYSGTISGPGGRLDIGGSRAAARWWWVLERVSKNKSRTACFDRQIDRMRLLDARDDRGGRPAGVAPLAMFDTANDVSLLAPGRDDEWSDPLQIDLAEQPPYKPSEWPPEARSCGGDARWFVTRSIPEGARADVLACYVDGKLEACPSNPSAVVALGDIGGYLSRRAFHAAVPFLYAAGLSWVVLLALTFRAARLRARALGAVVPESPR
jgi:hypothetical protein